MRTVLWLILSFSSLILVYILIKKSMGFRWLGVFVTHMALAAVAIYVVNYSGWITHAYIPVNPVTIGTVATLGLPGVGLLLGIKLALFA